MCNIVECLFRNVQTNFTSNCVVERGQIWVDELFNKSEGKLTQVVTWRLWLGHSIREESFSCCLLVSAPCWCPSLLEIRFTNSLIRLNCSHEFKC